MKDDFIHKSLLNSIREKLPQDKNLANTLMDILFIGKEAIYRRLRGEVPFTLTEVAIISKELDLSMDNILGTAPNKSRPFQLKIPEHVDPLDIDLAMMDHFVYVLQSINEDSRSELGCATNSVPQFFYYNYPYLNKLFLFKWAYQYDEKYSSKSLKEINYTDRMLKLEQDTYTEQAKIKNTFYIFDNMMFTYLINDIKYFSGINLIDREEVTELKGEIHQLINELEALAIKGQFDDGCKVQLYISNINFENTYSYIHSQNLNISLIKTFILNSVASLDDKTYEKIHFWIQSLKKCSTLISEAGEMQRIKFFNEQRKLTNTLE
ncbi:helix-turn-helix domain-containing protein [Dysgonomonas sp. 520]|uniref:helix-turn-helix domain-containing protein n=1 Tax=Dysgonomonas sp. 520 TaxID=2302931 RepID=UPI0013D10ED2|nr:helix-turn-helix domain-containing protein [Dysgonomonas sp. 520]NDW10503.1 hypothetical protein [Dysgonomonas sp. 520]